MLQTQLCVVVERLSVSDGCVICKTEWGEMWVEGEKGGRRDGRMGEREGGRGER